MIFVILAIGVMLFTIGVMLFTIGVMLFTIKEITKYGNSGNSSNDTTNSGCGHKQDKRGCKESRKCLHNKREV